MSIWCRKAVDAMTRVWYRKAVDTMADEDIDTSNSPPLDDDFFAPAELRSPCQHSDVMVNYDHPYGLIQNTFVTDLQNSDRTKTRPVMILQNPRCARCKLALSEEILQSRISKTGDLYDLRFRWYFVVKGR